MAKKLLVAVALVLFGAAIGVGRSAYDLGYLPPAERPRVAGSPVKLAAATGPQPRVVVEQDVYDFGKMQRGEKQKYTFRLRNEGEGVLTLKAGKPSCKCTVSAVSKEVLQPGEEAEVVIEWTTDQEPGPFRKTAPIHTNDRRRSLVVLEIKGRVIQSFDVSPRGLQLGRVLYDHADSGSVRIHGYSDEPVEVVGWQLENQETAEYFDVVVEPIAKEKIEPPDATSGQLLTLKVKPGLPEGIIRQALLLHLNHSEAPVRVAVDGRVTSDISIRGPGWHPTLQTLQLGTVLTKTGVRRELHLLLNGENHDLSKFKVAHVDPEELQVELGSPEPIAGTKLVRMPLVVSVPPGTRAINRLGAYTGNFAEVTISTDRSNGQPFKFRVEFATVDE